MVNIERLTELEKAATPGPWTHKQRGWADGTGAIRCGETDWNGFLHHSEENAALIVALRNAAPELLAVVEAARRLSDYEQTYSAHEENEDGEYESCTVCAEWMDLAEALREALRALDATGGGE